jgi:cytochrome c oxidase assembly protein subunit 15
MREEQPGPAPQPRAADLLALSFGTVAAMWTVGYLSHIPPLAPPTWLVATLLAITVLLGGYQTGRYTARGFRGGLLVGLISGFVNVLVLMSVIGGDEPGSTVPSAPLFVLGSLLLNCVLATVGAAVGTTRRAASRLQPNWTAVLTSVTAATTFVLLFAGGLVTSLGAGMAVPDWPTSFGYNMFLYPLAKMSGGIYFEHAHRLLGTLVGLLTLVQAIFLTATQRRPLLTALSWGIFALVAFQGVLGGMRVIDDDTTVGFIHGVLAQLLFAALMTVAVLTSTRWNTDEPVHVSASAGIDRQLSVWLAGVLVMQLLLGAYMRHMQADGGSIHVLYTHMTVAVIALGLAVAAGTRAWGIYPTVRMVRKSGLGLIHLVTLQVALGVTTWAVGAYGNPNPTTVQVVFATLHQAVGALLLAWTVRLILWEHRLLLPEKKAA